MEDRSALASAYARFDDLAAEIRNGLRMLSAGLGDSAGDQRHRSALVDLQALQLRLQRAVDQIPRGATDEAVMLEGAFRQELDLLARLKSFADLLHPMPVRVELHSPPTEQLASYAFNDSAAAGYSADAPPAAPAAGFYGAPGHDLRAAHYVAPPQYAGAPAVWGGYSGHQPIVYVPVMVPRPSEPEPRHDDDEPEAAAASDERRRQSGWVASSNFGGIAMMLLSILAGGVTLAERFYHPLAEPKAAVQGKLQERLADLGDTDGGATTARASARPRRESPAAAQPVATWVPGRGEVGPLNSAIPRPALPAADFAKNPKGIADKSVPQIKVVARASEADVASPVRQPPPAPVTAPPPPAVAVKAPLPPPVPSNVAAESPSDLYVPVLSTHKDAAAAREAFSALQKEHFGLLGNKQSEVQSSGTANGTWHRLVVTPATTKSAAMDLCNKLREAGYGRCWVKPY